MSHSVIPCAIPILPHSQFVVAGAPACSPFHWGNGDDSVAFGVGKSWGIMALVACDPAWAAEAGDATSLIFASVEAGQRSVFVSAGGKLLYPVGPETSVFVLAAAGRSLSDMRRAGDGKLDPAAVATDARLFLGVERSFGPLFTGMAVGPSLNAFLGRDGLGRQRTGVAVLGDVWYRPTSVDVFNATTVIDSGPRSVWVRLRYGRSLAALPFVVGPEAALSRSVTTRKLQLGLHVSEWTIGRVTVSLAGGWMWERSKTGPYVTASAYMKY